MQQEDYEIARGLSTRVNGLTLRPLNGNDYPQFERLLNSVYGNSYSYQSLYTNSGFEKLVDRPQVISLGLFSEEDLVGHTGLYLDRIKHGILDSGLSFRNPFAARVSRKDEAKIWSRSLHHLAKFGSVMNQNVTTYHHFAQMYSERSLKSFPTGQIFNFAVGEQFSFYPSTDLPMHAVTYASPLRTIGFYPKQETAASPFKEWIDKWISSTRPSDSPNATGQTQIETFGEIVNTELSCIESDNIDRFERNHQLDFRLKILLIPAGDERLNKFLAHRFFPVGIRIGATGRISVALQKLSAFDIRLVFASFHASKIYNPFVTEMYDEWALLVKKMLRIGSFDD